MRIVATSSKRSRQVMSEVPAFTPFLKMKDDHWENYWAVSTKEPQGTEQPTTYEYCFKILDRPSTVQSLRMPSEPLIDYRILALKTNEKLHRRRVNSITLVVPANILCKPSRCVVRGRSEIAIIVEKVFQEEMSRRPVSEEKMFYLEFCEQKINNTLRTQYTHLVESIIRNAVQCSFEYAKIHPNENYRTQRKISSGCLLALFSHK